MSIIQRELFQEALISFLFGRRIFLNDWEILLGPQPLKPIATFKFWDHYWSVWLSRLEVLSYYGGTFICLIIFSNIFPHAMMEPWFHFIDLK